MYGSVDGYAKAIQIIDVNNKMMFECGQEKKETGKDFKWNEKHMLKDEYIVGIFGKTSKIGLNQFGFIFLKSLKPPK